MVNKKAASEWAASVGISKRQWRKWIKEALKTEFIQLITSHQNGSEQIVFRLIGAYNVAQIIGCTENVGSRPVEVPLEMIINDDYYKYLWAAFLSTLPERPISRMTLRLLTSIPERNQLRYEKDLHLLVAPNYAITDLPFDHLTGFREMKIPHAQKFIDPITKKVVCAFRLPNTYYMLEKEITTLGRGSASRINRKLKKSSWANLSRGNYILRVYHENEQSQQSALNVMSRKSINGFSYGEPVRLYIKRRFNKPHKANLYSVEEV